MNHKAPRKIIHVDCDCFYAAVETLDNPRLRGVPLAVGGSPASRGVIATCNYEARAFGVRSAMPSSRALRLCPSLLILPPRFERYREVSRGVRSILEHYTDIIEPLSLDEAYMDVSESPCCDGVATRMAEEIRSTVRNELGITVSAGVAPNKFLAKIASDWRKPDGLFVIKPTAVSEFVRQLPVQKLHGVGTVTAARLEALGLHDCAALQSADPMLLVQHLGSMGPWLQMLAQGIDERPVEPHHERKSVSVEHTFSHDLPSLEACEQRLPALFEALQERLSRHRDKPLHKAVIKLRFDDFSATTRECVCTQPDLQVFAGLLREAYARGDRPVRLLGVGVRFAEGGGQASSPHWQQIPLPLNPDND